MNEIITTTAAAKLLKCHQSTIGKFCKSGRIRATKKNGLWAVDRESVEQLAKTYTPEGARKDNGTKRSGMMRRKRIASGKQVAHDKPRSLTATEKAALKYGPAHEKNLARIREIGNRCSRRYLDR